MTGISGGLYRLSAATTSAVFSAGFEGGRRPAQEAINKRAGSMRYFQHVTKSDLTGRISDRYDANGNENSLISMISRHKKMPVAC
jgi:hypothetical protein